MPLARLIPVAVLYMYSCCQWKSQAGMSIRHWLLLSGAWAEIWARRPSVCMCGARPHSVRLLGVVSVLLAL